MSRISHSLPSALYKLYNTTAGRLLMAVHYSPIQPRLKSDYWLLLKIARKSTTRPPSQLPYPQNIKYAGCDLPLPHPCFAYSTSVCIASISPDGRPSIASHEHIFLSLHIGFPTTSPNSGVQRVMRQYFKTCSFVLAILTSCV